MKTLNIITPVSRLENLPKIYEDLCGYSSIVNISWWIALDGAIKLPYSPYDLYRDREIVNVIFFVSPHKNAVGGHLHRSFLFNKMGYIQNQWCYMLDDDNLIHPNLIDFFARTDLDCDAYLFGQLTPGGEPKFQARPELVKVGLVDTAMVLFKARCVNGFKFDNLYDADGRFICYLKKSSHKLCYINKPMAYYNRLRPQKQQS